MCWGLSGGAGRGGGVQTAEQAIEPAPDLTNQSIKVQMSVLVAAEYLNLHIASTIGCSCPGISDQLYSCQNQPMATSTAAGAVHTYKMCCSCVLRTLLCGRGCTHDQLGSPGGLLLLPVYQLLLLGCQGAAAQLRALTAEHRVPDYCWTLNIHC
jgi:hypothetical protein